MNDSSDSMAAEPAVHSDDTSRVAFERYWTRSRGERKFREAINERREDGSYAENSAQRHWWTWQSALRSTGAPPMVHRAFEIADEAMFELLISEGAPDDVIDTTVIGLCDESSQEVASLAEASAAMREAFEWLQPRGYVELGTDGNGEFIDVVRRPGEDT